MVTVQTAPSVYLRVVQGSQPSVVASGQKPSGSVDRAIGTSQDLREPIGEGPYLCSELGELGLSGRIIAEVTHEERA